MTKSDILFYLSQHKEEFFQKFGLVKLGLFGSFVREEAHEDSDIDIIIELDKNVTDVYRKKLALKKELESYFNKKVDIAREKYLKPLARQSIGNDVIYV
ncbi:MAG: DNA polymerase beta domain protein region [uncultured Sulfurovum sp.]|uniref:DNA polymerase beta domain protein region n=1 Tax=uncultured Sulfurovum sp. TaxID=269237 RepID=A0A6S6THJ0_9BACT|nr:MAG: DNA polymerase beta domain protein region [uncultured Sulfurovum sp.]